MTDVLSIAICQIAPLVGDIEGNLDRIRAARARAATLGADLAVFCEFVVSGYPPEDLALKPAYQRACRAGVEALAADTADGGPAMIVGSPWPDEADGKLYNGCFLLEGGRIAATVYKTNLPNYGVFDEPRRYAPNGAPTAPTPFRGVKLGLMVCEDMWLPGIGEGLQRQGAELFIVPHGSPWRIPSHGERIVAARERVRATGLPLLFINQLGGQDEVVFDGAAFVMDARGGVTHRAPAFEAGVYLTRWARGAKGWTCTDGPDAQWADGPAAIYHALTLGVRDYLGKTGFGSVVLGLSGGVDSALAAAIAADALGPENVRCVMMPSRYTSKESLEDAEACAKALGVSYETIQIEPAVAAFDAMLADAFRGCAPDTTEENIQSRARGVLLMALSNKSGAMVLSTGNKSEMAVGYATLYGDMNGGYNPLKDVYKTEVFRLCRWRNANVPAGGFGRAGVVIPERIIAKPPSAELRADQKDADSLPPYDVLDPILEHLVEGDHSIEEAASALSNLTDEATVARIARLLAIAEYKRRQAPPGPKVTVRNFGRDRRYPITNGFKG